MWIMNAALVALGLVFLDRKAVLWSAFASFALSGYTSLFEWLFPVTASLTGDLWLDVCFAVLLPAVGSAIVFDIGASTGGTDILAMILRKRTDIEIGKALFAVDVAVVVAAIGIFGARVGLYCVLALIGKTFVVDGFIESIRQRKVCQVICDHPRDVEEFIVKKLGRTATVTFGWGAYSGKRQTILTSVLSRREAMRLRLFVRTQDPSAFITIVSSSENHRPRLPRRELAGRGLTGGTGADRGDGGDLSSLLGDSTDPPSPVSPRPASPWGRSSPRRGSCRGCTWRCRRTCRPWGRDLVMRKAPVSLR